MFFLGIAVEYAGEPQKRGGRASRALVGVVTHAVAVLAQISGRQGNELHRTQCHLVSPPTYGADRLVKTPGKATHDRSDQHFSEDAISLH